ncbi:MAG: hypothetical protein Q7T36_16670 [Fluviicoccus sp.]|uniref:hypothetical protein n=1 Tax=Fluviicoccus sp. TaxID=2003552 RepID=UPI002727B5EC|nr:hypothetical protein [Fluviicoccus sp.]MDO8332100.1 hypothetical protein [Fluviicoccus sp.]
MNDIPSVLATYFADGKPLVCELDVSPFICEFWEQDELLQFNQEYEVPVLAPGYFGFGTSGGGEMFAIALDGAVVCLPFIGMEPKVAMELASSWEAFELMLRGAI